MPFASDRDLLAYEPSLPRDVPLPGQELARVSDAVVTGVTLVSEAADFASQRVTAGHIALLDGRPVEIHERIDAHTLTLSRPRAAVTDDLLPPGSPDDGEELTFAVRTYAPQIMAAHQSLMARLGLEETSDDASRVVSVALVRRIETLASLARIYTAGAIIGGENNALHRKATCYQRLYDDACRSACVQLDLDGDGLADTQRQPGVITLTRV